MKTIIHTIAVFSLLCGGWSLGHAQSYPVKPVRLIIGFPPGGGTDIIGRIVAQKLSESFGQQVIVENRGGATGQIATEITARAAPDGYTIMMAHIAAMAVLPSLMTKLPYDPQKDFAPITLVALGPNLLVVHPSLPVRTMKDLVALARSRPGQLHFSSPGAGGITHIAGELLKLQANVDMLHVPYKGSGQAIVDLLAGHVHLSFDAVPVVINHVRQGKLRAIAVTSAKRFALLADIPTINESGLRGFDMNNWWGLIAPAAVTKDIVNKVHSETVKLLRQPDVKEKIALVGVEPVGSTPDEFAAFMRAEREKYAQVIKAANIKLE